MSVMPCYDKKLEAAREDFVFPVESEYDATLKIAEVDSVLTTGEVLDLIKVNFGRIHHWYFTHDTNLSATKN